MALVLKDRVKETTTTTGTGTYTLAGAATGFEAFSEIGDGNTTYYCCTDGTDFEVGIGTYTASGTTLARTTILQSSNSDAAVNWTSGTRDIFCTQPAEKAVFKNDSGHVDIDDNEELRIGTGNDLRLYHSGTLSYITNKTGNFVIGANDPTDVGGDLILRAKAGEVDTSIRLRDDGSVQINADGTQSMEVYSSQVWLNRDAHLKQDSNIVFEGATNDDNETTVTATDPTADRTITLPDATGTVQLTDGSGASLTSLNASELSSGTVPNARLDQQLQDVAGLAVTNGNFIVGDGSNFVAESGATARTSLGLGTIATQAADSVDIDGGAIDGVAIGVNSVATDLRVDHLRLDGNNLYSTTTNQHINISPNGTGKIQLDADTVRVGENNADATVTTYGTGDLTLNTNEGTNTGTIVIADGVNGNISLTPNGTGSVVIDGLSYPQADGSNGQVLTTNGSGTLSFTTVSGGGGGSVAADDITTGDAAVNIATSDTSITIDAEGNNGSIALKGTDGGSDITALFLSMASAGFATFNAGATFKGNVTLDNGTHEIAFTGDGSKIAFPDQIDFTHVADTGVLLDRNFNTVELQLYDSNESVGSDGTNLLLKSGGTSFKVPTSDGSSGQFLKTDGSGNLSFATVSGGGGTIASQDADSVNIDGGAIDAVTLGTNSAITEAQIDLVNINGFAIDGQSASYGLVLKANGQFVARIQSTSQNAGGGLYLYQNNPYITFEGATGDVYETNLKVTDPTADRDITLPDATGTVALDESTGMTLNNGVIALKNGGTQSEVRLYCESSNAHYAALKAPAHADFAGNVTSTLPSVTGTLIGTANADAPATTTSSSDADHVLVNDGGVLKKITPSDLGIGSGSGGVTVQDEGSSLSTTGTTLNFVGSGVVASGTGATKTITIAGGGGSASDSFKTISVSGQSDVVADSSTDTLTLVAGSNMTITTDASGDSITFASSGGGGGGGASNLNGLSDVTISSVQNNDLLKYNSTAGEWQNTNLGISVTPTLSGASTTNNTKILYEFTVTNNSSYDLPAYKVVIKNSSGTVIYDMDSLISGSEVIDIDTDDDGRPTGTIGIDISSSTYFFGSSNNGSQYTIEVQCQDFGDLESEVATLTVTVADPPQISMTASTYRYWRIKDFDNQVAFKDWRMYSGTNQSGTVYPDTNAGGTPSVSKFEHSWTSNGQTNTITTNFSYSSTYGIEDMFNYLGTTSTGIYASAWWTLGTYSNSNWNPVPASKVYENIVLTWDLGTARSISSMLMRFNDGYTSTCSGTCFVVQGSSDNTNWTTVATLSSSDEDFSNTSTSTITQVRFSS